MEKYSLSSSLKREKFRKFRQMSETTDTTANTTMERFLKNYNTHFFIISLSSPTMNKKKSLRRGISVEIEKLNCITTPVSDGDFYSPSPKIQRKRPTLHLNPTDSRLAISDSCLFSKSSK